MTPNAHASSRPLAAVQAQRGLVARWLDAPPKLTFAGGALLAAMLLVSFALLPQPPGRPIETGRITQLFSLNLGLFLLIPPIMFRSARSDLAQLQLPRERFDARCAELARLPTRSWATWTLCAVGIHVAILLGVGSPERDLTDPAVFRSKLAFMMLISWLHIFGFATFLSVLLHHAAIFRRLGRELPDVDLLDRRPLAPFVRNAMRQLLVFSLCTSVAYLFHIDWTGGGGLAPQMIATAPIWLAVGTALFLLPLWGVHSRLHTERCAELERVYAALRGEHSALAGSRILRRGEALSTVDLLAYREQIESLGTWPFGPSGLARFLLYLGIPLASWIGGALVEFLLERTLE